MKKLFTIILLITNIKSYSLEILKPALATVLLPSYLLDVSSQGTSELVDNSEDKKEILRALKSDSRNYIEFGETTESLENLFENNPQYSETNIAEMILEL